MTYQQAVRLRNDLIGMIGDVYEKRMVNDVVIAPVDDDEFSLWTKDYLRTEDQSGAILPFTHSDLKVLFVYKYNGLGHRDSGYFIYGNVLSEAKNFGVEVDINKYK